MSPLEISAIIVGIWCTPAVLLSAFVAYKSRKGDWGDRSTPHELYLQRVREVEQEQAMARASTGRERRSFEADRGSIPHGTSFRERQAFPHAAAAGLNRVVPQRHMVLHYAPEEGALARISLLVMDGSGACFSDQWTAYLN